MIAEGDALIEGGGIVGEQLGDRGSGDFRGKVAVDPVPDHQKIMAAVAQHPARFGIPGDLVGKEHHAELADDEIEAGVLERKVERIGLPERDLGRAHLARSFVEHGLVEVGRDDVGVGKRAVQRLGDDAGARRRFEDTRGPELLCPLSDQFA